MGKIYIYGCGNNGKNLLEIVKANDSQVEAFIDRDTQKHNTVVCGILCISLESAMMRGAKEDIVLVSPSNSADIVRLLEDNGFKKVFDMHKLADRSKFFIPKKVTEDDFEVVAPFNRYDSPYPDLEEIYKEEDKLFCKDKEVNDINLNIDRQKELISKMWEINAVDWSGEASDGHRYYSDNDWFGKGSADCLYYMMRIINPKKIIEVGSGFSTSVMLDTNNAYFDNHIKISCIEPYPERLKSLLMESDNLEIHETYLQNIPLEFFDQLQINDILFIDSSHVAKTNSDINYLFFEILPCLQSGVYIHFHDMFWPFEYPKKWIYQGRGYNELYLLRAFLMNNRDYSIQYFGNYLCKMHGDLLGGKLENCGENSLWIRKN